MFYSVCILGRLVFLIGKEIGEVLVVMSSELYDWVLLLFRVICLFVVLIEFVCMLMWFLMCKVLNVVLLVVIICLVGNCFES